MSLAAVFLADESETFQKTVYRQKGKYRTEINAHSEDYSDFIFKAFIFNISIGSRMENYYIHRE